MPKSEREWAQRKLEQAIGNIETANTYSKEIYQVYNPVHPEIGELMIAIGQLCNALVDLITDIKKSF